MTTELKQTIELAQSLSLSEQLELLTALSHIIQQNHAQVLQMTAEETDVGFSAESLRTSWQQAMSGETLPLAQA
jgi:hypothetical protein